MECVHGARGMCDVCMCLWCDVCGMSDTCVDVYVLCVCVVCIQGVYGEVICVYRWSVRVVYVESRVCVGCVWPVALVCVWCE